MSETTPETTETTPAETTAAITGNPPGPAPVTTSAPAGATFTPEQQAEINRQIGKARDEGRKAAADEAKRKHAEDEAKAKGEWEKVATERQAHIDRLTADLAARDRALLVAKVAAKHRLPESVATRLLGTTEDELEADAKALAKDLAVRAAPETEAGVGTGERAQVPSDRPHPKRLDGPVYGFGGTRKVPWPDRAQR
jgi:hypothetical protein